jgi:antitoxin VapB
MYILLCILYRGVAMAMSTAKVFTSGNGQAIRLPKEFRLDTDEVFISRSGDSLIITPRMKTWDGFIEGLKGLSADFDVPDDLPPDVPRKSLD